ncbi:hypothetical protein M8A51_25045 [Schlegelella sp. S2-27]|uniref:DUF3298 domain-containing protein n=1 Tax=Caldimonas mangrovi TaxID=2944811 RepID=A0ABT0YVN2_9BURK|nr:hypothetical protein [Caldimonas mangrovi]MCM5682811.1 hypothetical protein [Caldimonas mangrovi]
MALLVGCATPVYVDTPPKLPQDIFVDVERGEVRWGLRPFGAYQLPGSQVFVIGSQHGMQPAGMFGLLTFMVADGVNQASVKAEAQKVGQALAQKFGVATQEFLDAAAQRRGYPMRFGESDWTQRVKGLAMTVDPSVVLHRVDGTKFRPYVALHVERIGETVADSYDSVFVAIVDEARPLGGKDGWIDEGQDRFRPVVLDALRLLADAMLEEVSGGLPRTDLKQAAVALRTLDSTAERDVPAAFREGYAGRLLVYPNTNMPRQIYLVPPSLLSMKDVKPFRERTAAVR